MKLFFAFLIVILLIFSGYHLTFRGFKLPLFARKFYLTGTEFLFLGLLLGPEFLDLLDAETSAGLAPLSAYALGWIGLLFGFQFEISKLRRFPVEFFLSAILESCLTSLLVFAGTYMICSLYFEFVVSQSLITALVFSATAACTAQTGLALVSSEVTARRKSEIGFLRFISGIDGLSAMLILGLVFFSRPILSMESLPLIEQGLGVLAVLGLCIGLLILFSLFIAGRLNEGEMVLVVIGMTVITSGAASILNFSPLFTNFFMGICLVNLSRNKESIFNMLVAIEKPIYLLILIFLGATWQLDSGWLFFWALAYAIFRGLGKLSGGYLLRYLNPELKPYSPFLGLGLLSPGGLPMAVLLDFNQGFPLEASSKIISIVLLAVIYSDIASPHLLGKVIKIDPINGERDL